MKKVIELDESLAGEVINIKDDFAVGPLSGIETEEGWQSRVEWWKSLLQYSPYKEEIAGSFDDRETVAAIKKSLDENETEQVWIWMAQNQHDVCGYYWLVSQFKDYAGRIMVLYFNNLPFINEKGQLFYPSWLGEIQPTEFLKAKKLARPVTPSEFEVDPDEWKRITEENAMVRMLEGGKKLSGKDETFYDADIMRNLTAEWQKAGRLFTNILNRMKIKTGDVFIMWRTKELIDVGKIEMMGERTKTWKDVDLRLPGKQSGEMAEKAESNSTAN